MPLQIDHVTMAGMELDPMRRAFAEVGLATEYGGAHSGGVTHMALLGFDDGSYIELIAAADPGRANLSGTRWAAQIAGNAGPAAWAARVEDIAAESARILSLGVPVAGPIEMSRQRPDGALVEWELAFLGDQPAGAVLPFLIQDHTPRDRRVVPSPSVAGSELRGVARVVLGVHRIEPAAALFQRAYGWPDPVVHQDGFDAQLAHFAGTPVILAAPAGNESWLAERLERFGEMPCAFLLGSVDIGVSAQRPRLERAGEWFGQRVAWFDRARLHGIRLGVIQVN
jgi:hypothetical protein